MDKREEERLVQQWLKRARQMGKSPVCLIACDDDTGEGTKVVPLVQSILSRKDARTLFRSIVRQLCEQQGMAVDLPPESDPVQIHAQRILAAFAREVIAEDLLPVLLVTMPRPHDAPERACVLYAKPKSMGPADMAELWSEIVSGPIIMRGVSVPNPSDVEGGG